eukprot:m.114674 g.114674  ORF g.114674 m.114674 type:complete len:80 (+) comp13060_c0_seq4:1882-2121(+)
MTTITILRMAPTRLTEHLTDLDDPRVLLLTQSSRHNSLRKGCNTAQAWRMDECLQFLPSADVASGQPSVQSRLGFDAAQ